MIIPTVKNIVTLGRSINTIATTYFVGQIGWKIYKKLKTMQKNKLQTSEVRIKFIEAYTAQFGKPPEKDLVDVATRTYGLTNKPLRQKLTDTYNKLKRDLRCS